MTSQTLTLTQNTISAMQQHYHNHLLTAIPYSVFRAKINGVTITAYESGKVLFQGNGAEEEAKQWGDVTPSKPAKSTTTLPKDFAQWTIIGSDEVGNGSYFGALTVCAVYVPSDKLALLNELGIKDSKDLSDKQIIDLAWQIKATVPYHLTVCPPVDYNRANSTRNADAIKVALHNFTIQKLIAKLTADEKSNLQGVLIDQFTDESNYYRHLKNEKNPYQEKIYFEKKGESHHLAVASASIIARAAFLESLETLGQPYQTKLPSGAGTNVDQFAVPFVKQYGKTFLEQTAKLHFRNTDKIMNQIKR